MGDRQQRRIRNWQTSLAGRRNDQWRAVIIGCQRQSVRHWAIVPRGPNRGLDFVGGAGRSSTARYAKSVPQPRSAGIRLNGLDPTTVTFNKQAVGATNGSARFLKLRQRVAPGVSVTGPFRKPLAKLESEHAKPIRQAGGRDHANESVQTRDRPHRGPGSDGRAGARGGGPPRWRAPAAHGARGEVPDRVPWPFLPYFKSSGGGTSGI